MLGIRTLLPYGTAEEGITMGGAEDWVPGRILFLVLSYDLVPVTHVSVFSTTKMSIIIQHF